MSDHRGHPDPYMPALSRHGLVIGLAGFSGSGKTTLAEKLIAHLTARGLRIATIKHAHHDFDPDTPGKDSWRHRQAGARQVLISSSRRRVHFTETPDPEDDEADLNTLLGELAPTDLVLVEGFKNDPIPKIEIRRQGMEHPPLYESRPHIIAIATDHPLTDCPLPQLDLNDPMLITNFLLGMMPS